MDIIIEESNVISHKTQANINLGGTTISTVYFLNQNGISFLNIFKVQHRVPDVWRYTVNICNGVANILTIPKSINSSYFSDRPAIEGKWLGREVILLILESPHRDEYDQSHTSYVYLKPIAPAQGNGVGDAGGAIERYLHLVLTKMNLVDGFYSLIIANPIPYCCSLGVFYQSGLNKKLRDNVWKAIWNITNASGKKFIQDDFTARCAIYKPKYIINCCTSELQCYVTTLLVRNNFTILYKAPHPAMQWNINYKKGIPVEKI